MNEAVEVKLDKKDDKYDEYDCRHFAETLLKAEEIKNDPKKMAAADKHLKSLKKEITSLEQLKKVAKEKMEGGDEEEEES